MDPIAMSTNYQALKSISENSKFNDEIAARNMKTKKPVRAPFPFGKQAGFPMGGGAGPAGPSQGGLPSLMNSATRGSDAWRIPGIGSTTPSVRCSSDTTSTSRVRGMGKSSAAVELPFVPDMRNHLSTAYQGVAGLALPPGGGIGSAPESGIPTFAQVLKLGMAGSPQSHAIAIAAGREKRAVVAPPRYCTDVICACIDRDMDAEQIAEYIEKDAAVSPQRNVLWHEFIESRSAPQGTPAVASTPAAAAGYPALFKFAGELPSPNTIPRVIEGVTEGTKAIAEAISGTVNKGKPLARMGATAKELETAAKFGVTGAQLDKGTVDLIQTIKSTLKSEPVAPVKVAPKPVFAEPVAPVPAPVKPVTAAPVAPVKVAPKPAAAVDPGEIDWDELNKLLADNSPNYAGPYDSLKTPAAGNLAKNPTQGPAAPAPIGEQGYKGPYKSLNTPEASAVAEQLPQGPAAPHTIAGPDSGPYESLTKPGTPELAENLPQGPVANAHPDMVSNAGPMPPPDLASTGTAAVPKRVRKPSTPKPKPGFADKLLPPPGVNRGPWGPIVMEPSPVAPPAKPAVPAKPAKPTYTLSPEDQQLMATPAAEVTNLPNDKLMRHQLLTEYIKKNTPPAPPPPEPPPTGIKGMIKKHPIASKVVGGIGAVGAAAGWATNHIGWPTIMGLQAKEIYDKATAPPPVDVLKLYDDGTQLHKYFPKPDEYKKAVNILQNRIGYYYNKAKETIPNRSEAMLYAKRTALEEIHPIWMANREGNIAAAKAQADAQAEVAGTVQ